MNIEAVKEDSLEEMLQFLRQREDYTLFLLNNFKSYGPEITQAPYSGNFKLIRNSDKIVGVFCLTRNGTLLIDSGDKTCFEKVLASCKEESIPIGGLIGDWEFCKPFWDFLLTKKVIQEKKVSKEVLYSVDVSACSFPQQTNVRFLSMEDFGQWKPLRLDYLNEQGLPNSLTDEQLLQLFSDKVNKKIIWGLFLEGVLVAMADFNAIAFDLGQVGGVYTAPKFRQRGFSKSIMKQLFLDAKRVHHLRKLIIFTGEMNVSARNLYESFGVAPVGYYGLLFGG